MVICGFAGIGKTYLGNKYKNVIDLESSDYKWIYSNRANKMDKEKRKGLTQRNVNYAWPDNYLDAITDANAEYDLVLVSQSLDILDELHLMKVPYILVFPKLELKEEYIQRCIDRGNQENFIWFIDRYYEKLIKNLMKRPEEKIILDTGEYLEDALIKRGYLLKTNKQEKKGA